MPPTNIRFDVNDDGLRTDFFDKVLPRAIAELDESVQPEWGRLTPRHMVEHLLQAFKVSNGKIDVPCVTPTDKLDRMQAFLYSKRSIPKGFQAPFIGTQLPQLKCESFEDAKAGLMREIQIFLKSYEDDSPDKVMNPVFGLLGVEDWHRHHYKHCYHHFAQFNLIAVQE